MNSDPHLKDIPVRYRHWRLADFPDSAQAKAREWLEDPGSWSLYLQGAVGTRKTSLAAAIVHECRIAGIRAMFCTLPRAVHHIRHCTDWWQGEIERIPVLAFDDLGAARDTPHYHETLRRIFSARYNEIRKTIVTSNVPLDQLVSFDERLADRLREGEVLFAGKVSRREGAGGVTSPAAT